jgi:carboxylesterase type B
MISEGSRGLFQRGILMAGSALHNGYFEIPRRNWAHQLATLMGMNGTSEREILSFLENSDAQSIIEAQSRLLSIESSFREGLSVPFGPTVEPYRTNGVFLDDSIPKLVRNGWGNNISIIIGATSKESLEILPSIRAMPQLINTLSNFENFIPRELNITRETEESQIYAENMKRVYYGRLAPSVTNIDGILTVMNDVLLWYPAFRTVRYRLESNAAPTYVYRFDADSQNNVFKGLMPSEDVQFYRQPSHGDDVAHLFKSRLHRLIFHMDSESYNTLHLMVSMFTNFAASGNPITPEENLPHWPSVWHSVERFNNTDDNLIGLNIKENSTSFGSLPEAARSRLFKDFELSHNNGADKFLAFTLLQLSALALVKHFLL